MAKKNQLTKSDYLPMDEYKKLLKCLHSDKQYLWELYARLSFCTALRASDVLTIKWSDILQRAYMNKTEKKTGKTRKIPFNKSVQDRIAELYILLKKPNEKDYIFQSKITGEPLTIQYINRQIKTWKAKYQIHIDNFSTHTFRKTFGRYVYDHTDNKSEALLLVNSILQHSTLDVTRVYIGLREDEINSVFSSIDI